MLLWFNSATDILLLLVVEILDLGTAVVDANVGSIIVGAAAPPATDVDGGNVAP